MPDDTHALLQRRTALVSLGSHPSWPELEAVVTQKQNAIERIVISNTLGSNTPVDVHELSYWRGYVQGIRWLVAVPSGAEDALERILKKSARNKEGAEA